MSTIDEIRLCVRIGAAALRECWIQVYDERGFREVIIRKQMEIGG